MLAYSERRISMAERCARVVATHNTARKSFLLIGISVSVGDIVIILDYLLRVSVRHYYPLIVQIHLKSYFPNL